MDWDIECARGCVDEVSRDPADAKVAGGSDSEALDALSKALMHRFNKDLEKLRYKPSVYESKEIWLEEIQQTRIVNLP